MAFLRENCVSQDKSILQDKGPNSFLISHGIHGSMPADEPRLG